MPFVYNSTLTRPNTSVSWFRDANPAAYQTIVSTVKAAPGYISGTWEQDPTYPNKFVITHTWTDKASWKAMSDRLKAMSAMQLQLAYRTQNNIAFELSLSE